MKISFSWPGYFHDMYNFATEACFKRRILHVSNTMHIIFDQITNIEFNCFRHQILHEHNSRNCIRHVQNATFERGLKLSNSYILNERCKKCSTKLLIRFVWQIIIFLLYLIHSGRVELRLHCC